MTPFSVYKNPNPRTNKDVPLLLDVQSEVTSGLATRIVVPLYCLDALAIKPIARLTPVVTFQNQTLIAMVPQMTGLALRDLGPRVGDLASLRGEVLAAIDLLLTGF